MALVRAVEWAVRHPKSFATVYAGIQAGAAWVGYKYTNFQISNIKKAAQMVGSKRKLPFYGGRRTFKKTALGLPPRMAIPKAAPKVIDNSLAPGSRVAGAIVTLGNSNNFITKQRSVVGRKRYWPKNPSAVLSQYRWQSIEPNPIVSIDRSLQLHPAVETLLTPAGVSRQCLAMPVYCFNLSALGENGKQVGLNSYQYVTCPMYRLYKDTGLSLGVDTNLSPTVQNYFWSKIVGKNNSPGSNVDNYQWNREVCDDVVGPTGSYRHLWSHVQMMIDTDLAQDQNMVHVDIIKFKNEHCAPRREFFDANEQVFKTYDMALTASSEETSALDVFWESFLTHRLLHPLLDYNIPDKEKQWRVVKSHQIEFGSASGFGVRRHNFDLFYHNGSQYDLVDNQTGDTVVAASSTDKNNDVVQGNLNQVDQVTGTAKAKFNQLTKSRNYEMFSRDRKTDTWMLIYADIHNTQDVPTATNFHFDMKVKSKYEVEPDKSYKLGVTIGGTTYEVK